MLKFAGITRGLDMLFVVQFEDVYADYPERLPERTEHMAAHLTFLSENCGRSMRRTSGQKPSGPVGSLLTSGIGTLRRRAQTVCDEPCMVGG